MVVVCITVRLLSFSPARWHHVRVTLHRRACWTDNHYWHYHGGASINVQMKIKIELASQHCYIGAQSGDRSNQIAAADSLARIHVGCRYDDDDEHTEASTPHSTFHRYSVHHIFVYWRTLFYFLTASPITNPSIRNLSNRSKKISSSA